MILSRILFTGHPCKNISNPINGPLSLPSLLTGPVGQGGGMSKRRRSQQGSSEEEGEEEEHRRNSYPARVTMSTKNKTLLPGIQPPFLTYGASGGIQGVFCAMPMQPFPFSSVSSSVPFMPLPPQMFYTAAAGSPYGSQPLPILTGAGPGSAFLYPQLAAASQAAYISAQGKSPTSPPVETHANKQESPEDEEQSGGESPVIAVATPSVTNASSGNEQLLLASQNQTLMYRIATQGQDPLRYPSQAMMPLGQSSRIPGTEATTAALSASSEDKKLTLVPSDVSLTSGSASVVSRLIAQKNKQPLANSQKPKTLKKLLTGATKLQEDPLYAELQDEPHFVNFLRFFASNERSKHLRLRLLKTEGSGVLKWIEVSLKASHIDASIGPVDVARILLSSNGLCKLQILFPYFTTVFTKFVPTNQEEADDLLGELSVNHILCPGLPNYEDKFAVLGYHPSHVRAMETSSLKRYDHDKCPLWHVPSNLFSKSGHLMHNMCKQCRNLQANLVRQATKACEIDPRERESWTDPSSHRPLAFMSAADKEERYRKLRQERTQMLVKLKAYEEQLGNGESCTVNSYSTGRNSIHLSTLHIYVRA